MTAAEFVQRLDGVKRTPNGWQAKCPSHDDQVASLSIATGDDGRTLLTCFAGCEPEQIVGALGLTLADLFDAPPAGSSEPDAVYSYVDEAGAELFQVVRFPAKRFRQRRRTDDGSYSWSLNGTRRTLYRLPLVLSAIEHGHTVYVAEGEKDVHALERAGVIATCNPGGAGKWRPEFSETLRDASVVVIADKDGPGRKHAREVASSLADVTATVRVVEAAAGKDAADHLSAGRSVAEFVEANQRSTRSLARRRLADVQMKSIEWLDRPLFQRAAFHLIAGKKGTGKGTYLADLASRVTQGDLFAKPMNVVFVSSEDSDAIDIRPRVTAAGGDDQRIYTITERVVLPRDIEALRQTALEIGDVGLVVIDPIGNHLGGADTDAESKVRDAIAPLNDLADELDCLLVGVRHLTKNTDRGGLSSVLGSTAWVDTPRSVLVMAADDEEEMLFHIEVVAGNRGPRGSARKFRIDLADVGLKEPVTKATDLGESNKSTDALLGSKQESNSGRARTLILELLDGVTEMESDQLDAQVAQQTGLTAGTVQKQRMKLKDQGLIKSSPKKDESGTIRGWYVRRTNAELKQVA